MKMSMDSQQTATARGSFLNTINYLTFSIY